MFKISEKLFFYLQTIGRPCKISALHVHHFETLGGKKMGGKTAAMSAAAINIDGFRLVELLRTIIKRGAVEPIELMGTSQMACGKLIGTTHIEQICRGIRL